MCVVMSVRVRGYVCYVHVRGYVQAYAMWLCMDVPWLCPRAWLCPCANIFMYVCVVMSVMPVRSKPRLCTYTRSKTCCGYVHVWLCVVMCGYVCPCAHTGMVMSMCVLMPTCELMSTWLCPLCYVMLCYVMLCYVMSVVYTSPRRNHSVHEYKYFVKPLPSAA